MKRSYKRWSKEEVLRVIGELSGKGKQLNSGYIARNYPALAYAGRKYCGSWESAVKAAGLDYTKIKRQKEWSKGEIVVEIKRMRREGVELRTTIPVRKKYRTLHAAAIRYFGSWAAAMKAAKLERLLKH
jgi:hypothetical protein